jgi:hypothetical protein
VIVAQVRSDGTIQLGEAAQRAGFRPGVLVEIILTSSGSLILALDDSPPPIDVSFKPLVGGAAQLAARNARRITG